MRQDLRYAFRMLCRDARYAIVAAMALALGIGVNTAVFTAYKASVARPLDARNPRQMVNFALARESGVMDSSFSYADYEAYRDSAHAFSGLIAFAPARMRVSDRPPAHGAQQQSAYVFVVSENYFRVLGVKPLRGIGFEALGMRELASSPAVLISENYWRRQFGGDPAVIGKRVRLNSAEVTIIGITPHDFVGTSIFVPDFWLPASVAPLAYADARWLSDRENRCCRIFGRLAPGAGVEQARAELDVIAGRLRRLHDPRSDAAKAANAVIWSGSPFPLPIAQYHGLVVAIAFIMAAAGMVLVVACANVGSLQLARARHRENELRTRLSLGASRARIVKQLLTENVLLALLSGVLALTFAWAFLKLLEMLAARAMPETIALVFDITPDGGIFFYVSAMSTIAGILFGLAPALESSRVALFFGARGSTAVVRSRRIQDLLIAAQVGLSLALMIAGSMFIRSALNSLRMDTGYDARQVMAADFQFPVDENYTEARKLTLARELRRRMRAIPGVTSVSSARAPADSMFRTIAVPVNAGKPQWIHYAYVQANYFETVGIPLLMGRSFDPATSQGQRWVILSESAARELWPGQNPIGRGLRLGAVDEEKHDEREVSPRGPAWQVAGVARDIRGFELNGSDSRLLYLPLADDRIAAYPLLMRAPAGAATLKRSVDAVAASVDPAIVLTASTLHEQRRQSASFLLSVIGASTTMIIGSVGLLLALSGIYGTVSYIVALRTREIGIRMAVGAQRRDILGLILRQSTRPVVLGLAAGASVAGVATYLLRGVFYGIAAVDGVSFGGTSLLFFVIALMAAYPPARRAMTVDPAVALRDE